MDMFYCVLPLQAVWNSFSLKSRQTPVSTCLPEADQARVHPWMLLVVYANHTNTDCWKASIIIIHLDNCKKKKKKKCIEKCRKDQ